MSRAASPLLASSVGAKEVKEHRAATSRGGRGKDPVSAPRLQFAMLAFQLISNSSRTALDEAQLARIDAARPARVRRIIALLLVSPAGRPQRWARLPIERHTKWDRWPAASFPASFQRTVTPVVELAAKKNKKIPIRYRRESQERKTKTPPNGPAPDLYQFNFFSFVRFACPFLLHLSVLLSFFHQQSHHVLSPVKCLGREAGDTKHSLFPFAHPTYQPPPLSRGRPDPTIAPSFSFRCSSTQSLSTRDHALRGLDSTTCCGFSTGSAACLALMCRASLPSPSLPARDT